VRVAEEFHAKVNVTGLVMTKMDGDARGGAALSIRWVSGVPIKFIGIGEKVDALEPFYPDRLASRILGMATSLLSSKKRKRPSMRRKHWNYRRNQKGRLRPGRLFGPA